MATLTNQTRYIGDGWVIPQTQESHNTTSKPVRHRPYPYAIVPKTPLRVGCGCILYCMETRCIGCMLQLYILHASSRLARHAIQHIQRIQLYSYTRYTAYSTIQPPSGQEHSARRLPDSSSRDRPRRAVDPAPCVRRSRRPGGLRPAAHVPRRRRRLMRLPNLTKLHVHPCHYGAVVHPA